jgi:hypothetical protein
VARRRTDQVLATVYLDSDDLRLARDQPATARLIRGTEGFSLSFAKQALGGNLDEVIQTVKRNVHLV